jgi:hypothetical protein
MAEAAFAKFAILFQDGRYVPIQVIAFPPIKAHRDCGPRLVAR